MCRWMAWHGQPVLIEELLLRTEEQRRLDMRGELAQVRVTPGAPG
jgi:hypothetical protein